MPKTNNQSFKSMDCKDCVNKNWGGGTSTWLIRKSSMIVGSWPILGVLGYFGGTENGTSGARIKILRSLFNTNTPLKPPFSHFGNHFRPRKSDFWPFYWFWSFSHWNSHWSRKIFRTAEGKVVHQKQNLFWKSETKWNNLKPCKSWNSKFHQNKNHLTFPAKLSSHSVKA